MAEYRFEGADFFATQDFHADREVADHLNEPGHMARLWVVAALVNDLLHRRGYDQRVVDYGCGNGGLLSLLHAYDAIGYDFQPSNVAAAQALGRPVVQRDFVTEPDVSAIAVMSEVLEHMDNPHQFLKDLNTRYLVASVPLGETPEHHYEFHVWGWDGEGFAEMLKGAGFTPLVAIPVGPTQVWVAHK